jgi:hypothetical protein
MQYLSKQNELRDFEALVTMINKITVKVRVVLLKTVGSS